MMRRTRLSYYQHKWWLTDYYRDPMVLNGIEGEKIFTAYDLSEMKISIRAKKIPFDEYIPYYDDEAIPFFKLAKELNLRECR